MIGDIADLKARYSILDAWPDLGLSGTPGRNCPSPFPAEHKHGDRNPSFSVYADGTRWKDHATGQGGDVVDLVAKTRGIDVPAALSWIRERLGIDVSDTNTRKGDAELRPGTAREIKFLARLRNLQRKALTLASSREFLLFATLFGHHAWAVTDRRRQLVEFRRTDGHRWEPYGSLSERKAHCRGAGKSFPIGAQESAPYPKIAFVEGAPDILAVFHFLLIENKVGSVAPVGMLGASNRRIAPEALGLFKGKLVCLYPHVDDAGHRAGRSWAEQLTAAGAYVLAFDLSGCVKTDGSVGKDLNDVTSVAPDCFDRERKFWEVLP